MEKSEDESGVISFSINGENYSVNPETENFDPETNLVDFIRDRAGLKGTKFMCREGGCGVCIVTVKYKDPVTGQDVFKAVNSCLIPVLSCCNWEISTIEGLGNKKDGLHKIQKRLAYFNGSQCGFCSPGMVMNMHSLMSSKKGVTIGDVDFSFDGNICRCTGYRPILDAFKSFAVDAPEDLRQKSRDIEDCGGYPCSTKKGGCCKKQSSKHIQTGLTKNFMLPSGQEWIHAATLEGAFENLSRFERDGRKYRVVAGNTGIGVFKHDGPYEAFLDINSILDLKKSTLDTSGVVLGAGITLTNAIKLLADASELKGYEYTSCMSKHLERVANLPVRNNATIAGNLMMKHAHHNFPSDVFLILETVGAKINIGSSDAPSKLFSLLEFLGMDMRGKLITSLYLPQRKGDYRFRSFRITRRYQNAHAYVNAGFLIKVDTTKNFMVLDRPRILLGGINDKFIHATASEAFLCGKCLGDPQTLKGLMEVMDKEIQPDYHPPDATAEYRKTLSKSLLYKTILGIVGDKVRENIRSGGTDIQRGISSGKQTFDEPSKEDWVLYQNVPKLEANVQVTGEAEYINDIPPRPDELFGAFVFSTVANAELKSIDASEALCIPGVVAFVSEKDIPGKNNYMSYSFFPYMMEEPVFAKEKERIRHAGQSLGMIVAKSNAIAWAAAKKVKVAYENKQEPIVDIAKSLQKVEDEGKLAQHIVGHFKSATPASPEKMKHIIKGEFRIGSQYHFHMEAQGCICVPKEDGMDVFTATQWMDQAQIVIAEALGVHSNNINVEVRRLGGSFGGKISKATHLSTACAIAANAVRKPVRLVLPMETNMSMLGKRLPYLFRYVVGFEDEGKIQSLKAQLFCDCGSACNEQDSIHAAFFFQNTYEAIGWELQSGFLLTNTPSNTFCRAPGTTQGVACIEYIMEHIAHKLKKDPLEVRLANFLKTGDSMIPHGLPLQGENLARTMIDDIKISGDFEARKQAVESFNKQNRWKKRGISLVPVRYVLEYMGIAKYPVNVVIYHQDGYVAVSHGGIEMGQGLNTKVAQTVAYILEIPLDRIIVRPSNNFSGANSMATGGSLGSEVCCGAAKEACQILVDRMAPIKKTLEDKSWDNVVKACYNANLDLTASYMYGPNDKYRDYLIWMVNLTEVEVDMLTGEYKVARVDLIEDAGKSLSPGIDIGQIEGAYLMGQGLWTTEKIVHDEKTGQLLTNNTWEYKPPETKDIPEDFRITMLSNAPNPDGILSSKATGEPPLLASFAVFLAIKNAIDSARRDAGNFDWYQLDGPITPEDIIHHALTASSQFGF